MILNVGRKIFLVAGLIMAQATWAQQAVQTYTLEQLQQCQQEGYSLDEVIEMAIQGASSDGDQSDGETQSEAPALCPRGTGNASGGG